MKNQISHQTAAALRIKAIGAWVLSGVLAVLVIGSICVYSNPWITHRLVARETTPMELEALLDSTSPYVKFDAIDLTFTEYYKAMDGDQVVSYCFRGEIAGAGILVELPAEELGDLLEPATEVPVLESYELSGQLIDGSEMIEALAGNEDMAVSSYLTENRLTKVVVRAYGNVQERTRIIQMIMVLLAAGALAAGWILWAEAKVVESENLDTADAGET